MKITVNAQIPVTVMKEGDFFICYSPAFELATHGETYEDAEKAFADALKLFLASVSEKGTWGKVLHEYGWTKIHKQWTPPVVIKQESFPVKIPACV